MRVGVGYSDYPDSALAGTEAANKALSYTHRSDQCDMVLLFCTARHNQQALREAVASAVGEAVPIYGGGAVGIITNKEFGYAGDQVGVACLWLDGVRCDVLLDGGLLNGEEATGQRLGQGLAELGVTPDAPVMLFYDAVDRNESGMRLMMATWLLEGLRKGLGFLPDLTGAGVQGDHICSPTGQFIGDGLGEHYAMTMAFSDDIRIDSTILHGCRPASQYYTVTKAEGPVILEINGKPALEFVDSLLDSAIEPEEYPFFLLFGINHGDRWGEYNEEDYASRLCLDIDKKRGGIVMFEPDMVAGTEFQLMFRSLDYEYMKPKIEALFDRLEDREPVFAVYIDCAGRCAGYGGLDMEDAVVVQQTVGDRVPLLGLYTGVEIASIGGRPRGLDWTGVFCLFSRGKAGSAAATKERARTWEIGEQRQDNHGIPLEAALRLSEQNAAKVLSLDTQSIAIRHELEQKRRGFSLLAELSVSLRQSANYESVFIPVAQRINAALNMQKTAVLVPADAAGWYRPSVLQGYTVEEKASLAGQPIQIPPEMLDAEHPVLVTGADDPSRLSEVRSTLQLPYFISTPVVLQQQVAAVLITGRMMEAPPFLSRLGRSDLETVQAIGALLASVLVQQRLEAAEERTHIMVDAMPLSCVFWDEQGNLIDCNAEALRLFGFTDKAVFLAQFDALAPDKQPDGHLPGDIRRDIVRDAFVTGSARLEVEYKNAAGERIPAEVTLVRVPRGENYNMVGYIRDLREQKAAMEELTRARDMAEQNMRAKSEFLAAVSHEVRTPANAVLAMARTVSKLDLGEDVRPLIEQGTRSARMLTTAIDSILDFSRMESGEMALEEKPFSPRDIADGIVGMLFEEATAKSVSLHAEIDPGMPESVVGDAARLEQAVYNLVANAVKFTEKGEVILRVYAREMTPDQIHAVFEVRDTGIGIDDEAQQALFQPLSASDTSYTRKYGGLGMGLAVSRSIAQLMQGDIALESSPGAGSVFTLTVLLGLPAEVASTEADSALATQAGLEGLRVLVAEDNAINQMIVEELLATAGVRVVLAGNGLEALQALKQETFDLVLMDIQMPEMDGLTAAAQIRADPRYDDMPILAMTANAATEHRAESLRSGMNDHLTKPIEADEIYAALRRWGKRRT